MMGAMKRFIGRTLVFVLTVFHLGVVALVLFGWAMPRLFLWYGAALWLTAASWLVYDRCVLVDAEHFLRQRFGLPWRREADSFVAMLVNRLVGREVVSKRVVHVLGTIVLVPSIFYWSFVGFFAGAG
jgi:hypothetical protein